MRIKRKPKEHHLSKTVASDFSYAQSGAAAIYYCWLFLLHLEKRRDDRATDCFPSATEECLFFY